jgi:hypothetical protein
MNFRTTRITTTPGKVVRPKLLSRFFGFFPVRHSGARARSWAIAVVTVAFWFTSLPVAAPNSAAAAQHRAHSHLARRAAVRTPPPPGPVALPQATPQASPQTPADAAEDPEIAGQKVKLYYFREATKIVAVLDSIKGGENSKLKNLVITNATEDEIILYGPKIQRGHAYQIIATLDLPRPGINMEMWGIQISSRKPDSMAQVMPEIRAEIDRTQQAVRETYAVLEQLTREVIPDSELDVPFRDVLVTDLGYKSALDSARPLSLADILLRMIAAREAGSAAAQIANRLDRWLNEPKYRDYVAALNLVRTEEASNEPRVPFERFFSVRGLRHTQDGWVDPQGRVQESAEQGRKVLIDFALNYGRLVHQPQSFSAYYLQQSAESLNSRLQAATDALNFDMQGLFVAPTLARIQRIVRRFKDVEYAQVGKVSVASLSGVATVVTANSVNAFDVTPPLRLSELLSKADQLSKSTVPFVPKPADNVVGAMPLSQVIGLIGALGEERTVWRELKSGVSLTITPNVLRNMASAELKIALATGDPQAGTREQGVKPLSRVSQHDVNTSVYVNALDFFDLSAFASQSTLGGGRGFVPIIGPVWQGIFGPIPVVGKLFSWEKEPQTVFSESLVLTNSFITPTAMGIALLFPTEFTDKYTDATFEKQREAVETYKKTIRSR